MHCLKFVDRLLRRKHKTSSTSTAANNTTDGTSEKRRATTAATPTAAAFKQVRSLETDIEGKGSTATRTDLASQGTNASTQPPELVVPASVSGASEPPGAVQGSDCDGQEPEPAFAAASLWDRAVVQLATSDAKLVADYEELLLKHLIETKDVSATHTAASDATATDITATDTIATNTADRPMLDRNKLERMLDLGLDRKEKNKLEYMVFGKKFIIEDKISEATDLVLKFKNFVSEAVKVSSEASLAWAGVCVILPLFTNPSTAYEAQSSGFHYVISRVQLYAEYERRIRERGSGVRDDMTIQLEALLVDLYKELLRFQLSTVVYFYRSWIKNTVKSSLLADEWESMVNKVKDAEGTVAEYLTRLQETDMISTLEELQSAANKRCADLKTLLDVSMQTLNVIEDIKHLIETDRRPLDLQIIAEACHDSAEVAARGQCIGGTRSRLKGQIAAWFNSQSGPNILWLTGPAGMGKSTVSLTIADEYAKDKRLAASYFFSRARQGAGEILQFLPTIASQLAQNFPIYKSILRDALEDMSGEMLAKKSLQTQFDILFRGLLEQEHNGLVNEQCQLVIVDALDECKQQTSLGELVDLLAELASSELLRLRIFITSRDGTNMSAAFLQLHDNNYKSLDLHKDFSDESTKDIQSYLINVFEKTNLAMKTKDPKLLLRDQDLATIIDLATNPFPLFIYASTFNRFLQISSPRRTPRSQLDRWLQNPDRLLPQLTQLYLQVLREAFKPSSDEQDYFTDAETLKTEMMNGRNIITAVVLAAEPLSPSHLACLLRMELHIVTGWLQQLRAVLSAPDDFNGPIHLLHKSFSDFLLHDTDPASEEFRIAMHTGHTLLAEGCLERIRNDGLRRDICGLEKPGFYAMDVAKTLIAECIPGDLAYASRHWLHHVNMAERQLQNLAGICDFIEVHLLYWLEALSLLESIANAILGTSVLAAATTSANSSETDLIRDARRFVLAHATAIKLAPLQAYVSALIFSPRQSLVKKAHKREHPNYAKCMSGIAQNWNYCVRTIEIHEPALGGYDVDDAVLSGNGRVLAVATEGYAELYDTTTWDCIFRDRFEDICPCGFAISYDGNRLAFVSTFMNDIQIWDWATRNMVHTFSCHTSYLTPLQFFENDTKLACMTEDGGIELRLLSSGVVLKAIGPRQLFAHWWNPENEQDATPYLCCDDQISDVLAGRSWSHHDQDDNFAFSAQTGLLARVQGSSLELYDNLTGKRLKAATIPAAEYGTRSSICFFDHDDRILQFPPSGPMNIWDTETLTVLQTIEAPHNTATRGFPLDGKNQFLTFDGEKRRMYIWDVADLRKSHKVHTQQRSIDYLACVSSASWLITLSTDGNWVQVWDTKKAICLRTIRIDAKSQHHELYNPDQMRRRILVSSNGKVLLIGASKHEIQVRSIATGACIRVTEDGEKRISPVALSPDGQRFALDTEHLEHFHIYGLDSNVPMRVKKETKCAFSDEGSSFQALFSPESAIFAYVVDNEVYLTDMDTTERSSWCLSSDKAVACVEFSADGQLLAACLRFGEIVIWNISGSVCKVISEVQWEPQMPIAEVAFSDNGLHVGAMGFHRRFAIWNIATGTAVELAGVRSLQLRTDNRWIKQRFSFHVGALSHIATLWGVREFAPDDEQLMYAGFGLSEHSRWIMKGSEKVIYLPPEYRCEYEPYVMNSVIVLRHDTGKCYF